MAHVDEESRDWRAYVAPIALSMGTLAGLNGLWNLFALHEFIEHSLVVYLLGGSGLALVLIWRALRDGRLTKRDLGLDLSSWSPAKRLLGVALILFFSYGGYSNLQRTLPPGYVDAAEQSLARESGAQLTVVVKPSWGDFSFWFVLLLGASLAELLVFVGVGFCMTERCLIQGGMNRLAATTVAALLASIAFGLYHFTHARSWWPLVFFPLMPVMFINLICFVVTRNFYLTLGLHGAFAALGMTQLQYMNPSMNPGTLQDPAIMVPALLAFVLPFLVLHWMESKGGPREITV